MTNVYVLNLTTLTRLTTMWHHKILLCPYCGEPVKEGDDVVRKGKHKSRRLYHKRCYAKMLI